MKKSNSFFITILFSLLLLFYSCATSPVNDEKKQSEENQQVITEKTDNEEEKKQIVIIEEKAQKNDTSSNQAESENKKSTINLLFGGDIMAHNENYIVDDYNKIWASVKDDIHKSDLAFANIESPLDQTKEASAYPYFNMKKDYIKSAIDAGFNVFSLCNNHTFDKGLNGIKETNRTVTELSTEYKEKGRDLYFSGIRKTHKAEYSYNIITKNDWTILFLPVTEILNLQEAKDYINYSKPDEEGRKALIEYCKKLREKNPCDLFIISFHTAEPEYIRSYTKEQSSLYQKLLDAGADIVWANHAHIIKDRKIIINTKDNSQKIIMYGNGNTISGQRRNPALSSKNPIGERDNTGDGLLYRVIFTKTDKAAKPVISYAKPIYITTYINTARHFILKKLDDDFINYLYNVKRNDWAEYIKRRKSITEENTKDLIEWQ